MAAGWTWRSLEQLDSQEAKPGDRWELSPELGIDAFNLNVAVLETGDRLSQNHFHYHHNQEELVLVASGRCRVDVEDDWFIAETDDVVRFDAGPPGVHLVSNPFDEPVKLIAIGWPPEGRHPVEMVATTDDLLAERSE